MGKNLTYKTQTILSSQMHIKSKRDGDVTDVYL